jgi:ribosomal protein L32
LKKVGEIMVKKEKCQECGALLEEGVCPDCGWNKEGSEETEEKKEEEEEEEEWGEEDKEEEL